MSLLNNPTLKKTIDNIDNWHIDWPLPSGSINLNIHDLPHDSSETEWWYLNSHLSTPDNKRKFSVFISFFRVCRDYNSETSIGQFAHSLVMGIVDETNKKYYPVSLLDPESPKIMLDRLSSNKSADKRLLVALEEMLKEGQLPLPDRLMKKQDVSWCSRESLDINYNGITLKKTEDGILHLKAETNINGFVNDGVNMAFDLTFDFKGLEPVRQGKTGVTHVGRDGEEMFYYFFPDCKVAGTIELHDTFQVSGSGWYDHEFGGTIRPSFPKSCEPKPVSDAFGWHWTSAQLNNGMQLSTTILWKQSDGSRHTAYAVLNTHDGRRFTEEIEFISTETFKSVRTYQKFDVSHSVVLKELDMQLTFKAAFEDQEFITFLSDPSFWEGRINITGTFEGKPVEGLGFMEVHGHHSLKSMDGFLKTVSTSVAEQIALLIPRDPSSKHLLDLMGGNGFEHYMDGLSLDTFAKTIINPLRDIIDRGGKAWRSYSCLLCIDCVGGDSRNDVIMLAMPELMHVGSLIIDDIQDRSMTRRGGPSCHSVYGEPIAINAGTCAYFLSEYGMRNVCEKYPEKKVRLYQIYFQALRAGHIGQAADIFGLSHHMKDILSTELTADQSQQAGKNLLKSVCATHRLKSAAPAGALARMGSILGGGTEEQTVKLGLFFEALGVAFQIMDDVLNIRGMRSGKLALKTLGEDLAEGKITYPVAKAMTVLSFEARQSFWERLDSKPQDPTVIKSLTDELEACNALEGSIDDATDMVEKAWSELSPVLPPSFYKAMLRAFSFFVLDRHY